MAEDTITEEPVEASNDDLVLDEESKDSPESALQVLLSAKPVRQVEHLTLKKREGLEGDLKLSIRSLTDREFKAIAEQAEVPVGNRANRRLGGNADVKETDNNLFLRLLVAKAIYHPIDLNDPKVLQAHGATSGDQIVARLFLPGEIARIADEVMNLSGWNTDSIELAKN